MNFSEIAIGAMFGYNGQIWRKLSSRAAINLENKVFYFPMNRKVTAPHGYVTGV